MENSTSREKPRDPQDLARLLVARANSGDVEGMIQLYAPDAVMNLSSGQQAVGQDAIREFYTGLISSGRKFSLGEQRPAIVNGDVALTSTRLPTGAVTAEVARRQADGSWRWVIDQPAIAK